MITLFVCFSVWLRDKIILHLCVLVECDRRPPVWLPPRWLKGMERQEGMRTDPQASGGHSPGEFPSLWPPCSRLKCLLLTGPREYIQSLGINMSYPGLWEGDSDPICSRTVTSIWDQARVSGGQQHPLPQDGCQAAFLEEERAGSVSWMCKGRGLGESSHARLRLQAHSAQRAGHSLCLRQFLSWLCLECFLSHGQFLPLVI